MTSLFPHQREILSRLRDPSCPTRGVLAAPPGAGMRRAVAIMVAEVASASVTLVLCHRRVIAEQWALLFRAEDSDVLVLDSAAAALDFLERQPAHPTGVVVATYARLLHGPSSRVLADLEFGLVVLDEPPRSLPEQTDWLYASAERLIGLTSRSRADLGDEDWPIIWTTTNEQLASAGHIAVTDVPYDLTSEERAIRDEVLGVLRKYGVDNDRPLALQDDSAPALHSKLLTLASNPGKEDLAERIWTVLDRMEAMRTVDTRLDVLDRVSQQVTKNGGRCVIMSYSPVDTRYIADHLVSVGRVPFARVDANTPIAERRSALVELAPGGTLVATTALCESADLWPSETTVLLWPSPSGQPRVPMELAMVVEVRPDIRVSALRDASVLT